MRHNYHLTGRHFSLRPVDDSDVDTIIELRGGERTRYLPPVSGNRGDQLAWLSTYYKREGDYYFAVVGPPESGSELYGFISVYDVNKESGGAQWGRVVLQPGSGAFPEATLLSYTFAFELLKVKYIYIKTIAENTAPIAFHDRCGLERFAYHENAFTINGRQFDAIEHRLDEKRWPNVKEYLARVAAERLTTLRRRDA
jgi:RimJ/RimL family protein N-acetyltransferase